MIHKINLLSSHAPKQTFSADGKGDVIYQRRVTRAVNLYLAQVVHTEILQQDKQTVQSTWELIHGGPQEQFLWKYSITPLQKPLSSSRNPIAKRCSSRERCLLSGRAS
jgi:hypothetical protein